MVHATVPVVSPETGPQTQVLPGHGGVSGLAPQAWISLSSPPVTSTAPGAAPGALAGLSFAAKDNMDALGLPTTAACPAFSYLPVAHAAAVQKLLDAGAQLLGKTNLDQFACGLNGTRSPYGAVPNAINPAYVSGGSSSGSAYVVATGQVDFALGTDTAGSGRVPAGLNNIVGLKPSRGLISARGVVPAAQSVDCISIFARTVGMAVKVLEAAMGHDPLDAYSRKLVMAHQAFGGACGGAFRFGVPSALTFEGDTAAESAFAEVIEKLKSMGGKAVTIDFSPLAEVAALLYESALVAERYTAIRSFFDAHEAEVIEPVRSIIAAGRNYSAADLYAVQAKVKLLGQQADAMWRDGSSEGPPQARPAPTGGSEPHAVGSVGANIDFLLVPTAPTHYTIEAMLADPVALNHKLGGYTNFVNLLDYAALSVPSAIRPDGLPFGITLIGPCGSDWQLAELGQRYHHSTGLMQGAIGSPLPDMVAIGGIKQPATVQVAVVGAHLSGMPLNWQLTDRGATWVATTQTAPHYRLYALPGTTPPKPGLLRVADGEGERIAIEIWSMPVSEYGSFVALIPYPLGIGTLALESGNVQGFVCEAQALPGAKDISHMGGWRAYIASLIPVSA